jgi:quercetin 2,3-dioxygenase
MSTRTLVPGRAVSRVTTRQRLGPDAQVDDKAIVIAPDDPSLTDPFLAGRR